MSHLAVNFTKSGTILTHITTCSIQNRGQTHLQIQVILDVTYTIKFTFTPVGSQYYVPPPQESFIRDIPYIPTAMLEAIKLIHLTDNDYCVDRVLNGCKQMFSTLQFEFRSEIKSQEITKINKEHCIITTKLQDDLSCIQSQSQITHTELNAELKLQKLKIQTCQLDFDKLQCDNIELQKLLETQLQEIGRLQITNIAMKNNMKKIKTINDELSDEKNQLCEKNKRFLEMINNEKIKNSSLSNKLSDMTELYDSLLNTTY